VEGRRTAPILSDKSSNISLVTVITSSLHKSKISIRLTSGCATTRHFDASKMLNRNFHLSIKLPPLCRPLIGDLTMQAMITGQKSWISHGSEVNMNLRSQNNVGWWSTSQAREPTAASAFRFPYSHKDSEIYITSISMESTRKQYMFRSNAQDSPILQPPYSTRVRGKRHKYSMKRLWVLDRWKSRYRGSLSPAFETNNILYLTKESGK